MSQQSNFQNLGEVPICVAIDKSGSTYGQTLKAEIEVVHEICRLCSSRNGKPIRLLPWCDETLNPINLPENAMAMQSLSSGGGTDPSVLYASGACLQALKDSGIWFLLTDGKIYDNLVENFALKTAKFELHNRPCVVVVFGNSMSGPPATCDISVGIATYAVAPESLFLFHDIPSGRVSVMQAKGAFKELLTSPNQEYVQPLLNKYTTWAELPRISYEDLCRIRFAIIRELGEQEMALQDGLVVAMPDLLSGAADPETVEKVIKDDDNLKSIVLANMTRGTGKDLEAWLLTQQKPMPKISHDRPDVGGNAQKAITQLLESLKSGKDEQKIDTLRATLRDAHNVNWQRFQGRREQECNHCVATNGYNQRIRNANNMQERRGYNEYSNGLWWNDMDDHDDEYAYLERQFEGENKADQVFLPGFQRNTSNHRDEFTGGCMLCQRQSVLVILLRLPPNISTANFPRQGSYSTLAFPLAMANFAEMDIISFLICCDSCAFYLLRNGTSPYSETIIGALCLVSVGANQGAWLQALETALRGRFEIADMMTLGVAILDRMLILNESRSASLDDKSLFCDCVQWAKMSLVEIAEVPETLSPSFGIGNRCAGRARLSGVLSGRTFTEPGHAENVQITILRYPISGFVVLHRLIRDRGASKEQLQTLLFQRLLFHITEVYFTRFRNGFAVDKVFGDGGSQQTTASQGLRRQLATVTTISIDELLTQNFLDLETLASFQTVEEFEDIKMRTGPATAVFVHHLSRYGAVYPSPVSCFNALKVSTSMKKVILTPLAISEGLSADLISQM